MFRIPSSLTGLIALVGSASIGALSIGGDCVDDATISHLAQGLAVRRSKLRSLDVVECSAGAGGAQRVLAALSQNSTLRSFAWCGAERLQRCARLPEWVAQLSCRSEAWSLPYVRRSRGGCSVPGSL